MYIQGAQMSAIEIQTTAIVQDSSDLTEKTKFIRVSYGNVGNTKSVKSDILRTNADKTMLKITKNLLDSPELDAVKLHDNNLRKWMDKVCLPFIDWPGVLLLPEGMVQRVWDKLLMHREERHALISAFLTQYPELKEQARIALADEFDEADYPAVEEVAAKFRFYWSIRTFQTPESLKEISEELYVENRRVAQAQFSAAMEEITAVLRSKFFEMVTHLKEKLEPTADGKQKQLRESTITNFKEFLDDFDLRNVSNDVELAAQVAKAKALIGDGNEITIRSSEEFRSKVRAGMNDLTETLGNLVEEAPSRKFRLDD
jgi:hypothetical protein